MARNMDRRTSRARIRLLLFLSFCSALVLFALVQATSFAKSAPHILARDLVSTEVNGSFPYVVHEDNHQLFKRVSFGESQLRGRRLDCLMSATIQRALVLNRNIQLEADFDEFLIVAGVEDEGWTQLGGSPKYQSSGIALRLEALTGADPGNNQYSLIQSSETTYDDNGNLLAPSGAYFGNGINGPGGVIIADWNLSLRNAPGYQSGDILQFSRLRQWSQAAFGQWEYFANAVNANTNSLRFIIRSWITNAETQAQIVAALRSVGAEQYPTFNDRVRFRRDTDNPAEAAGFYAILGSPNGSGTGFLIATHKEKLGVKRVASITAYNHPVAAPFGSGQESLKVMLSFELEDVSEPNE